jgi:transposase
MHRSFYDCTRRRVRVLSSGPFRILLDIEVRRVRCHRCGAVKRERLGYVGTAKLRAAMKMRRFFAGESNGKITRIERSGWRELA